jgi:hypothetical protein
MPGASRALEEARQVIQRDAYCAGFEGFEQGEMRAVAVSRR